MLKTAAGVTACLGVAAATSVLMPDPSLGSVTAGFLAGIATNFGHELCKRFGERASAFAEKTWGLDKNEHIRQGVRRAQIAATQEALRLWRQDLPPYNAARDDYSYALATLLSDWCEEQEKDSLIKQWAQAPRDADDSAALRKAFEAAFGAEVDERAGMAARARQARILATTEAFDDAIEGALALAQWRRAEAIRESGGLQSLRLAFFREAAEGGGWFDLFLRAIGREFKADREFKRLWDSVQLGGISAMLLDDIQLSTERHDQLTRLVQSQSERLIGIKEAVDGLGRKMDAGFDEILRAINQQSGVPLETLRAILQGMGEAIADADAGEIVRRLSAKAEEYRAFVDRLNRLSNDDPEVARLRSAAADALKLGRFVEADGNLASAEARDLAGAEDLGARAKQKLLSAAESRGARAAAAMLRANPDAYREAAAHYAEAARIAAKADTTVARDYARKQGTTIEALGHEFGRNAALLEAIEHFREMLESSSRMDDALDWAVTQMNLGKALFRLGERESALALMNWQAERPTVSVAPTAVGARRSLNKFCRAGTCLT